MQWVGVVCKPFALMTWARYVLYQRLQQVTLNLPEVETLVLQLLHMGQIVEVLFCDLSHDDDVIQVIISHSC